MLNNDDFNLLNTLFPAWQQLTTKQQQIISQNASLIQVKKNNYVHPTECNSTASSTIAFSEAVAYFESDFL